MDSHVRMRDNNPSPHQIGSPATPLVDAEDMTWPSPPPSTKNSLYADKSRFSSLRSLFSRVKLAALRFVPPRSKPLFQGFERPNFSRIVILTALCLTSYPALYLLTLVAKDKSLFVVRLIVSTWCSAIGFALGYLLLKIGAQHLEAATWATVIHMSYEGGGMKLRDLARGSGNPTSFMPAFHIFRSRFGNRETTRRPHTSHDKRPWFLFLTFFVVLATLSPLLPFLFGRIMEIETFVSNQRKVYHEVLIAGDLSGEDVHRAAGQTLAFQRYGGNTFGTAEFLYGNDTVYFAQPSQSQFTPGGSGAGIFNQPVSVGRKDTTNNTFALTGRNAPKSNTGAVLRYPQWGIRIHCEKLPDPEINLLPFSNLSKTYAFVPRDFLRSLFGVYGMDLPAQFTKPDVGYLLTGDTVPSNIDPSTISYFVGFEDNGEGVSLHSADFNPDQTGNQGWTTVETVVVRFNTRRTPSGRFPVYSNKSALISGFMRDKLGYDAAVCVQKYEPWTIETYNTVITSPSTLGIIEKGNNGTAMPPSGNIRGSPISNTRYLNATGKEVAFSVAHGNSIYQITKDDSQGSNYLPSPTAVSFGTKDDAELQGYTELSPEKFGIIRARVGAASALPYLAGSGPVVAQSYGDETLAYVTFRQWQLISLPALVLILGIIGELFVPTLPLGIPRREFGVYSWLALFQSQELVFEAADDLDKLMSLDELEEFFSNKRVKFVAEKGEV